MHTAALETITFLSQISLLHIKNIYLYKVHIYYYLQLKPVRHNEQLCNTTSTKETRYKVARGNVFSELCSLNNDAIF
jgi:hypothetical protein